MRGPKHQKISAALASLIAVRESLRPLVLALGDSANGPCAAAVLKSLDDTIRNLDWILTCGLDEGD